MRTMQETFATAGEPKTMNAEHTADEDVVLGALGFTDPLGAALWRARYKGDPAGFLKAKQLLAQRLGGELHWQAWRAPPGARRRASGRPRPLEPEVVNALAHQVVCEWAVPNCTECHGSGKLGTLGAMRRCGRCSGSGQQPAQHAMRARNLGASMSEYHAKWEGIIARLLTRLDALDSDVDKVLRGQLRPSTVPANTEPKGKA